MNAQTAGPWAVCGNEVVFDHRYQVCCGHRHGEECCGDPEEGGEAGSICECNNPANARLIAAAPDLLAACLAWRESKNEDEEFAAISACEAAIAKATEA